MGYVEFLKEYNEAIMQIAFDAEALTILLSLLWWCLYAEHILVCMHTQRSELGALAPLLSFYFHPVHVLSATLLRPRRSPLRL